MSRRYPVRTLCETCGVGIATKVNGQQRPHACRLQWNGERIPWPFYSDRQAARRLGVTSDLLHGLMNQASKGAVPLRGVKTVAICDVGQPDAEAFYVFARDDVDALATKVRSAS